MSDLLDDEALKQCKELSDLLDTAKRYGADVARAKARLQVTESSIQNLKPTLLASMRRLKRKSLALKVNKTTVLVLRRVDDGQTERVECSHVVFQDIRARLWTQ